MTSHNHLKYSYWGLAFCAVIGMIPHMASQIFALVFSIMLIIAFYVIRHKKAKDSFEYKEASHLIKTFWIWSAIYVGGMLVAGGIISSFADMTTMNEWTESVVQGTIIPDEEGMKQVTQQFMDDNFWLIVSCTVLSILPAQIYVGIRIKQGLSRLKNPPETMPEAIIG